MADSQMEAVKRAYAEIMLNMAKESAARVLAAERRAAAMAGGLAAAKDDGVATLLRLKAVADSRIKEVELQSLAHAKKIQELEEHLHDAQNTIASLQVELQRANNKLEQTRKTLSGENRNSLSTSDKIDYSENSHSHSKIHLQDGSIYPSAPETSADVTCHVPRNEKESRAVENLENHCMQSIHTLEEPQGEQSCGKLGKSGLAPFITRDEKHELYRNGCTQRIRALEQHSLNAETPMEQKDKQDGELKSYLMTGKNNTAKNPDHSCSIMGELLQIKNQINYKRKRGKRRSKLIYGHASSVQQGNTEYKPSDTSDGNGCLLLLEAIEQDLSPAMVSARNQSELSTHLKDDLLIGWNEAALDLCTTNPGLKDLLQVNSMKIQKRKRSKTIRILEPGSFDSKGVVESGRTLTRVANENSISNGRHSSESIENRSDTPPMIGCPLLLQCNIENVMHLTDAKPGQFESENSSPLVLEPIKNKTEDEGNLPGDHPECRTSENNTAGVKEVNEDETCNPDSNKVDAPIIWCRTPENSTAGAEVNEDETCNPDSNKVDAPIVSSLSREDNAKLSCGTSIHAEGARCIKYTFNRRKRKHDSLDNTTESSAPEKSSSLVSPTEKQEPEAKNQREIALAESPRSNRQLVQVARQLISLSEKNW